MVYVYYISLSSSVIQALQTLYSSSHICSVVSNHLGVMQVIVRYIVSSKDC